MNALQRRAFRRSGDLHVEPRETFERGRTAFGRAEYKRAIEVLNPLLYPEVVLDSEGEVVQAHRMLGVAYLFAGQPEEAKREFHKLLELRPDYRFDPLLDPPQVVDFFNGVLHDYEGELAQIDPFAPTFRRLSTQAPVLTKDQVDAKDSMMGKLS